MVGVNVESSAGILAKNHEDSSQLRDSIGFAPNFPLCFQWLTPIGTEFITLNPHLTIFPALRRLRVAEGEARYRGLKLWQRG
jgi:hypothetical protein